MPSSNSFIGLYLDYNSLMVNELYHKKYMEGFLLA